MPLSESNNCQVSSLRIVNLLLINISIYVNIYKQKLWKSKISDSITACLNMQRCNVIVRFSQNLKPQVSTIA